MMITTQRGLSRIPFIIWLSLGVVGIAVVVIYLFSMDTSQNQKGVADAPHLAGANPPAKVAGKSSPPLVRSGSPKVDHEPATVSANIVESSMPPAETGLHEAKSVDELAYFTPKTQMEIARRALHEEVVTLHRDAHNLVRAWGGGDQDIQLVRRELAASKNQWVEAIYAVLASNLDIGGSSQATNVTTPPKMDVGNASGQQTWQKRLEELERGQGNYGGGLDILNTLVKSDVGEMRDAEVVGLVHAIADYAGETRHQSNNYWKTEIRQFIMDESVPLSEKSKLPGELSRSGDEQLADYAARALSDRYGGGQHENNNP